MELSESKDRHWYVLYHISRKEKPNDLIENFNREGHNLELFAPIIRPAHIVNGKVRYVEKLLTFYYIFVKGEFEDIKELCVRRNNELSLMLDRSSTNRYATISDGDMENFKLIARAHANVIPFFNIDDIELNEGDLVEVVGGQYNGLRGTFIPKNRSNKGNLVISATADMGAILWDIDAKIVRILEFARNTRRQYDFIDAFIPKLLSILRKYHANIPLADKEKSQLNIFNLRMGIVSLNNHKAEAKLLGVLMCVQTILADMPALKTTRQRFEKRKRALTNLWTMALIELMMSVVNNDMQKLRSAYDRIYEATEAPTKTQSQLLEEFKYYLS